MPKLKPKMELGPGLMPGLVKRLFPVMMTVPFPVTVTVP